MSLDEVIHIFVEYAGQIFAGVASALFIGLVLFIPWMSRGRGKEMVTRGDYVLSRRQRRLRQNEMMADGINELCLRLYAANELTEADYERWVERCGKRLGLRDLLPRKLTGDELKAAIRKRTMNGSFRPVRFFRNKQKQEKKAKNKLEAILQQAVKPAA